MEIIADIFEEVIARLKANAAHFTDAEQVPPKDYRWYTGSYLPGEDQTKLPFLRPAIQLQFEPVNYTHDAGVSRKGNGELIVHVIQDLYIDGREGAAQLEGFLNKLQYPVLVEELLEGFKGNCFGPLRHLRTEPDHDNNNLLVARLHFGYHFRVLTKHVVDP